MFSVRRPSDEPIRRFLAEQSASVFSYSAVGATANQPPAGFVVDHTRIKLGEGEAVFLAARAALRRWGQFDLGWVSAEPPETPIQVGAVVAVVARTFGLWSLNAAKIIYVVDESGPIRRFGMAYGTMPGHVERGEERFLIEWDPSDNSVYYDILAFSRPNHVLAWLGYPVVRRMQARFRRESASAMLKAVRSDESDRVGSTSRGPD